LLRVRRTRPDRITAEAEHLLRCYGQAEAIRLQKMANFSVRLHALRVDMPAREIFFWGANGAKPCAEWFSPSFDKSLRRFFACAN
jgi:hypothetical protein